MVPSFLVTFSVAGSSFLGEEGVFQESRDTVDLAGCLNQG